MQIKTEFAFTLRTFPDDRLPWPMDVSAPCHHSPVSASPLPTQHSLPTPAARSHHTPATQTPTYSARPQFTHLHILISSTPLNTTSSATSPNSQARSLLSPEGHLPCPLLPDSPHHFRRCNKQGALSPTPQLSSFLFIILSHLRMLHSPHPPSCGLVCTCGESQQDKGSQGKAISWVLTGPNWTARGGRASQRSRGWPWVTSLCVCVCIYINVSISIYLIMVNYI